MNLAVFSHKLCWPSASAHSGYATDGGFALQMHALSELFDSTRLVVPCLESGVSTGEVPIAGKHLSVVPLSPLGGHDLSRKARLPLWVLRNTPTLLRELRRADAVHASVPGDVGTFGMCWRC